MNWEIKELLDRLQTLDESCRIEAKESKGYLGKSARETISAFSNEPNLGGGYLLLGIKENNDISEDDRYTLTGVLDPDKIQCELASACREEFNVRLFPEIQVEFIDGVAIVVAFIPEAFSRDKPVHIKRLGIEKGTFRRIGSADFRCTEDDLDLLYQLRRQCRYESEVLPHTSYEDISEEALEEYYRLRAMVNPKASELKLDKKQLLLALGVGIKNKEGVITPTIAGLALFGKREAIKRVMPAWRVDYIVVEGTKWVSNSSERYKFAIEYYEPLIILMLRLHTEVMGDLPMKFELKPGSIQRNDIPLIPREVIRESIANMLMHRDYRITFLSQVVRYSNRIEFKNGGYSLKSLEELLNDSGSMLRNPAIAKVFHDLKFAEGKGTGISSMRDNLKDAGFTTPPIFETDRCYNRFDLILFPHHLLDENTINWLSYFKEYNLNDADKRALAFIKNVGAISNADYRQLNGVDTLNASRGLSRLKELDLIQMKGSGSNTFYVLSKDRPPQVNPKHEKLAPHTCSKGEGLTPYINPLCKGLTPYINPLHKELSTTSEKLPAISEEIKKQIKALKYRSSRNELKNIIKNLCSIAPLQASQLSKILGKDSQYLRIHFLSKMTNEGELVYLYPEQPAHPKQAYKTRTKN